MANIQSRKDKNGKIISYSIRVHKGRDAYGKQLKPYSTTWVVPEGWSAKKVQAELNRQAVLFEKQCKEGIVADNKQSFEKYARYVIDLKERNGLKHRTIKRYNELLERINPAIGHIKLTELKPQHLNAFYQQLSKDGMNLNTGGKLSTKTISEYHGIIRTILKQAEKEMIILYNSATKASPPKVIRKEPNFLDIETIETILYYLPREPLKWQVAMNLLIFTGGRRGEVYGLKIDKIDFENNIIDFCNNLLYTSTAGIYEDTPKTEKSKRKLKVPPQIMQLIKLYLKEKKLNKLKYGTAWNDTDLLLTQDDGRVMNPSSLSDYCCRFRSRYNKVIEQENKANPKNKRKLLPHINPHAFRHAQASILLFEGEDLAVVSRRMGHANVMTTNNIYRHILEEVNTSTSDTLENIFLKNARS